jgi:pyruvate/2-oxoglutarate/acetoin dehydrogenase E1 component
MRDVDNTDIVIIGYGGMAPFILDAVEKAFFEEEICVTCLLVSQVKPLPIRSLRQACASTKKILIVEESVKYGGWGAELSAQLQEVSHTNSSLKVRRVGASEYIIPSAKSLESQVLPQAQDILNSIKEFFNEP